MSANAIDAMNGNMNEGVDLERGNQIKMVRRKQSVNLMQMNVITTPPPL